MKTPWGRVKETTEDVRQTVKLATVEARDLMDDASEDIRRAAEVGLVAFGAVALVAVLALAVATVALARTSRA